MKRTVVVMMAVASLVPAMAFAQSAPVGAWCGGSYGAEGTNFGECVSGQGGAQVAGQASGITGQGTAVRTAPEYPATGVTFEGGKAYFEKKELNLNYIPSPDRAREIQAGDGGGGGTD